MASQVRPCQGWVVFYIYLIRFGCQPQHVLILIFSSSFFFHFPFLCLVALSGIGDIAQLNLPVGMKDLNLAGTEVTGKATSE